MKVAKNSFHLCRGAWCAKRNTQLDMTQTVRNSCYSMPVDGEQENQNYNIIII